MVLKILTTPILGCGAELQTEAPRMKGLGFWGLGFGFRV